MIAPSTGLPDSSYSWVFLLLKFTACFVGRRIHNEGEKARRLTIKKVQKFLGGCKGGRMWLWGQLVATLTIWLHLMTLHLAVEYLKKKKKGHFILSEKQETEMSFPLLEASSAFRKDQRTWLKDLGISEPYLLRVGLPSLSRSKSSTVPRGQSLPTSILVSSLSPRGPALPWELRFPRS